MKTNLLALDRTDMQKFFVSIGERPYRAVQVIKWVHQHGATHVRAMTNLSQALQHKLDAEAAIVVPDLAHAQITPDGTHKWLLKLADGNCIETVFIPEKGRGTLCLSSQVGCVLNCDFCATGKQGFDRNLTTAEIIGQIWLAVRLLSTQSGQHDRHVTNVVMMGMGEPLQNLDNVLPALRLMLDDVAYGLSKRRVTVSTAGVVPAIYQLSEEVDVALAVSLHAPNDELRNQLVPLNRKYPLSLLMAACKDYLKRRPHRFLTMEYVMLAGTNDQPAHAKQLVKLLNGIRAKMNLIPFNPFPGTTYQRPHDDVVNHFREVLLKAGIMTTVRKTRGDSIDAACGQLVGKFNDRTRRKQRTIAHQG